MLTPTRRVFLTTASAAAAASALRAPAAASPDRFAWLQTARIALAEGYVPPFYPKLECTAEGLAETTARMGADVLRFPAVSMYALYPTKHYPVHPELGGRDLFGETIQACRRRGLKVIPYLAVNVSVWPLDDKGMAAWSERTPEGRPKTSSLFSLDRSNVYLQPCLLSPIQEKIKAYVGEIVDHYDVDGIYFDGPYPYMSSMKCYCRYCQAAYKKATGKPVPLPDARLSPDQEREYYGWFVGQAVMPLMRDLCGAIRARKDLPIIFNLTPFLFTRGYSSHMYPLSDAFMFESRPGPLHNKLFNLLTGRSTGKRMWSYVSTPHLASREHLRRARLGSWYTRSVDEREVEMQGFTVLAAGAAPIYWGLNNRYRDLGNVANIKNVFDFTGRHKELLESVETVPFAGILTSTSTVDWYRFKPNADAGYNPAFYYGAFAVLKDAHIQAEPVHESNLSPQRLARYRMLYLPNVACLSERHAVTIRDWVRAGGSLIASYETSLYDENGKRRPDFALADVLGAHWKESPDWWTDLFLRFGEGGQPRLYPAGAEIPQDPDVTVVAAEDPAAVLATTVQAARNQAISPGLLVRSFGKGRVAYLAGSLEAVYYEARLSSIRELIAALAGHLLGDHPQPYRLEAPGGVFANLAASRNDLLLHVLVNVGDKWKLPVSREDYVAVPGIRARIRVPPDRAVKSVRLLRLDREPAYNLDGGYVSLELPPVEIYEGIHITLA